MGLYPWLMANVLMSLILQTRHYYYTLSNHLELVCIKQYLLPHTLLSVHFFIVGIVMQHAIFCPPPYQFVGLSY